MLTSTPAHFGIGVGRTNASDLPRPPRLFRTWSAITRPPLATGHLAPSGRHGRLTNYFSNPFPMLPMGYSPDTELVAFSPCTSQRSDRRLGPLFAGKLARRQTVLCALSHKNDHELRS